MGDLTRDLVLAGAKAADLEAEVERLRQPQKQMLLVNFDGSTLLRVRIAHTGRNFQIAVMPKMQAVWSAMDAPLDSFRVDRNEYQMVYDGQPYAIYVQIR